MKQFLFGSKSNSLKSSGYKTIKGDDDIDDNEVDEEIRQYFSGRNDQSLMETGALSSDDQIEKHAAAADEISKRLLSLKGNSNEDLEHKMIRESLRANGESFSDHMSSIRPMIENPDIYKKIALLLSIAITILLFILAVFATRNHIAARPPKQPTGPYTLLDVQEGEDFFKYYNFFDGPDSLGSAGYINYVNQNKARNRGIFNVSKEVLKSVYIDNEDNKDSSKPSSSSASTSQDQKEESFIYMTSAPTEEGHRDSIRLESYKRYNRGLFIIDIRHMPAGCGTWPAFWMTDKEKWPLNGEIDIIEGVNKQTVMKTALHSSQVCTMDDVPPNSRTGKWDIAQGVPDDFGHIDMTAREVTDCFVWNPHQWLNEGCVAVSDKDGTLGTPLNEKGGGVFVLEWDPINSHLRTWVFTPHLTVPTNLRESINTASNEDKRMRVTPDPSLWGLPFGYFPIGRGTNCPSKHFQNMQLIFNLAFCGTVSGNRFFLDCPVEFKKFGSCEKYIASNPEALREAYWKIRGVYVYEREWENQ